MRASVSLKELARFLVKAKVNTYASHNSDKIIPQRPGFDELVFSEGDLSYRDSYSGFYFAPGQEVAYFKGNPIWVMAYSGGMDKRFHCNELFAKQTFGFLKEALKLVKVSAPFRGPKKLKKGDFEYVNSVKGKINSFVGNEKIYYKSKKVFEQDYIGGLIIQR
ncbi:MAG: DUF5680 domain-containing protein [archaeon]